MKKHLLAATASLILSQQVIAAPTLSERLPNLPGAESVVFDENKGVYFVSLQSGNEPGDGSIVALNADYQFIATIANGLDNPKGIALKDNLLFASDMKALLEIDLATGKVVTHHAENAEFLNDVEIDADGNVYVSDMFTSAIYKLENNTMSVWMDTPELENPNGLKFIDGDLYVAAWGSFNNGDPLNAPFGRLLKVNPETKSIKRVTEKPFGNLDGIQVNEDGNLLVSDWKQGVIFTVSTQGEIRKTVDLPRGSGDIYYSKNQKTLMVPMALEGEVLVYQY
ncbi:putative Six-bladed beta-propeller, TolB-like [Vibrio nigripulchritudo SFn27]|uniref:Putative Six-bladed beta-propeller, TolB-like n=1 Tax=Vibrio nigripulchritudo TaxID=28173 RepID=U4JVU2_9VIBR|nr:SMP-30/gluconolactonase/LRE family protein [Vibrio nigripulchritudo]CCN83534.1 putative Six-bladed beta-propeller, TolB-like [Vibrio nigripulchritudo BLFn1]CCN90929.1 putative Six-bladed beta-propeller, TolB-like [Vibrio nigripulchritudo SFn27]CCN95152.1 putative Six-bladed beta-propeller, TolB-like [Vibrio nigripulchritudo ENn2]CCO42273.1 putative Six-bladed beta-propeller, TolB-like [Vibrio nigripulchritudo SFn135]CCO52168.1 putative Six-bladed beta-propeller, TolB-like [Vibrio nigripulch